MNKDELCKLLTSIPKAMEVAAAVNNPILQVKEGWNLTCWSTRAIAGCIQFGRFESPEAKYDPSKSAIESVAVVNAPESERFKYDTGDYPFPTTVLMLG